MTNKTITTGQIDAWAHKQNLTGIGRASLLRMIHDLQNENQSLRFNLTTLLTEVRIYRRSGICLSGWHCAFCKIFNGGIKNDICRHCNRNKKDAWGASLAGNQARYEGTFTYNPGDESKDYSKE